jgi:hypothetical protein
MPAITIPTTSVFATKETPADEVAKLIAVGLETMRPGGVVNWDALEGLTSIKYSRGWLIVRRAYLEVHGPELLTTLPAQREGEHPDAYLARIGRDLVAMRSAAMSWGELAVRVGKPETFVRKAFKAGGVQKDIGLRIGKGGRFAYNDPTLYQEHRVKEGAIIPAELKGRPSTADLINAEEHKALKAKVAERVAKAKAAKAEG